MYSAGPIGGRIAAHARPLEEKAWKLVKYYHEELPAAPVRRKSGLPYMAHFEGAWWLGRLNGVDEERGAALILHDLPEHAMARFDGKRFREPVIDASALDVNLREEFSAGVDQMVWKMQKGWRVRPDGLFYSLPDGDIIWHNEVYAKSDDHFRVIPIIERANNILMDFEALSNEKQRRIALENELGFVRDAKRLSLVDYDEQPLHSSLRAADARVLLKEYEANPDPLFQAATRSLKNGGFPAARSRRALREYLTTGSERDTFFHLYAHDSPMRQPPNLLPN